MDVWLTTSEPERWMDDFIILELMNGQAGR